MHFIQRIACVVGAVIALPFAAASADDIKWSQVSAPPRGLNLPEGAAVDILGIAPGDSLDEVRAKLAALPAGANGNQPQETDSQMSVQMPGGSMINAAFPSKLQLERDMGTKGNTDDRVEINFSAPSSGSQVLSITRSIDYNVDADQVLLAPLIDALKAKLGTDPQIVRQGPGFTVYRYEFNDGTAYTPAQPEAQCMDFAATWHTPDTLEDINPQGTCDVVLNVNVRLGISANHVKGVQFELADNERAKADLKTDFDFFNAYVTKVQGSTSGPAPAL